jgi:hypothetical protein
MKARFLPAAEVELIKELGYYSKARPGRHAAIRCGLGCSPQTADSSGRGSPFHSLGVAGRTSSLPDAVEDNRHTSLLPCVP